MAQPVGRPREAAADLLAMLCQLDQPAFTGIAVMPIPRHTGTSAAHSHAGIDLQTGRFMNQTFATPNLLDGRLAQCCSEFLNTVEKLGQ